MLVSGITSISMMYGCCWSLQPVCPCHLAVGYCLDQHRTQHYCCWFFLLDVSFKYASLKFVTALQLPSSLDVCIANHVLVLWILFCRGFKTVSYESWLCLPVCDDEPNRHLLTIGLMCKWICRMVMNSIRGWLLIDGEWGLLSLTWDTLMVSIWRGEVLDSKYRKFGGWRIQVKWANNRIRKESSDRSPPRPQSVRGGAAVDGLVMQSDKVVVV